MRTSHTAIKRMIQDEKKKLTDEQVFASRQFAAYLTDIAESVTGRYKRHSKVKTFYDTSEDAEVGHTDNHTIAINTGNFLTRSFPTKALMADSLVGIVGHECGHMLFTDFRLFYPHEPEDLSYTQKRSLEQIKKALEEKDEAVVKAISHITHSLANIMEDVYIEARMCDSYPGSIRSGILLNNLRFADMMKTVKQEIDASHYEVCILVNLLIQYAKTGDINDPEDCKSPLLNTFYACVPYIDNGAYDDDARVRFDSANQLLLYLWPHMKEFVEKVREDIKNGTSEAETAMTAQIGGGIPLPGLPDMSGKPAKGTGNFSHDTSKDGEEKEELQKVLEQELGRIPLTDTNEISEGEDGGTIRNNDYAGAGYVSEAASDMDRIMTQIAEDAAYTRYDEELTDELQQKAKQIRYGNAHEGIRVRVNRMHYVEPSCMEAYQKVAPPLMLISKRLQKQISQILKDYKSGGKLDNLPMGKRLNVRNAYHNDGRIFYKLKLPNDRTDVAVAVLNDESGSMCSCDRITYARAASIILHDFCKALDIPIAIYGHTEEYDVELFAYAEFDTIDNKDKYRLMDMCARGGNRDGAALRFVAERLMERPEEIKLLIIISDGQPAGDGYYGTEAEADLRGIKSEYTKKGIKLFAAAIGSDKPNIQRIYGDGFLDITNLEKLPVNLGKLIIEQVKNRYAA